MKKLSKEQKIFLAYRKEIKCTQVQYAGMWGISQAKVSLIEQGVTEPDAHIIHSIFKKQGRLLPLGK